MCLDFDRSSSRNLPWFPLHTPGRREEADLCGPSATVRSVHGHLLLLVLDSAYLHFKKRKDEQLGCSSLQIARSSTLISTLELTNYLVRVPLCERSSRHVLDFSTSWPPMIRLKRVAANSAAAGIAKLHLEDVATIDRKLFAMLGVDIGPRSPLCDDRSEAQPFMENWITGFKRSLHCRAPNESRVRFPPPPYTLEKRQRRLRARWLLFAAITADKENS